MLRELSRRSRETRNKNGFGLDKMGMALDGKLYKWEDPGATGIPALANLPPCLASQRRQQRLA
jgi:hypothetical protein